MRTCDSRFETFFAAAAASLGSSVVDVEGDRAALDIGARRIELSFDPKGACATFTSLIHVCGPGSRPNARLIADFNCNYLFNGGYALAVLDGARLYLCRACRLVDLDARDPRRLFDDFASRSDSVGIWYMNRLQRAASALVKNPDVDDSQHLVRA